MMKKGPIFAILLLAATAAIFLSRSTHQTSKAGIEESSASSSSQVRVNSHASAIPLSKAILAPHGSGVARNSELSELLTKIREESDVCIRAVEKANTVLSEADAPLDDQSAAYAILAKTFLVPPTSQKLYLQLEREGPNAWGDPSAVEPLVTEGRCKAFEEFDLLRAGIKKSAKLEKYQPLRVPVGNAVRSYLVDASEVPVPFIIQLTRVAILKDLLEVGWVDEKFSRPIAELDAYSQELKKPLVESGARCTNPADCGKSFYFELETSRKFMTRYLSLIHEIYGERAPE